MSIKPASEHQSSKVVKLLLLGDSGTGKTGSLISLLPKYKITVLDFDNGLDFMVRQVKDKNPELLPNLQYETFTEVMEKKGNMLLPKGSPKAYSRCLKTLDELALHEWDQDQILVLDSLTFFCSSILNYIQFINGTLGGEIQIRDWGQAMNFTQSFLSSIQSVQANFHYIVISHLAYLEVSSETNPKPTTPGLEKRTKTEDNKVYKAFPSSLGKKLPPLVGSFFNTTLLAKRGLAGRRILRTDEGGIVDLKSGAPNVPKELPLETGLASLFDILLAQPSSPK